MTSPSDSTVHVRYMVDDVAAEAVRLRAAGVVFRNDVISGPGGRQTVCDDPAGNPIELFEPAGP